MRSKMLQTKIQHLEASGFDM